MSNSIDHENHAQAKPLNTAKIADGVFCRACGWPVIHVCCNDEMSHGLWASGDWWAYCSNKGCKNHEGEEWGQSDPEFAFRDADQAQVSIRAIGNSMTDHEPR